VIGSFRGTATIDRDKHKTKLKLTSLKGKEGIKKPSWEPDRGRKKVASKRIEGKSHLKKQGRMRGFREKEPDFRGDCTKVRCAFVRQKHNLITFVRGR